MRIPPFTSELLAALKEALANLENVRMSKPGDETICALKHAIREEIISIETLQKQEDRVA